MLISGPIKWPNVRWSIQIFICVLALYVLCSLLPRDISLVTLPCFWCLQHGARWQRITSHHLFLLFWSCRSPYSPTGPDPKSHGPALTSWSSNEQVCLLKKISFLNQYIWHLCTCPFFVDRPQALLVVWWRWNFRLIVSTIVIYISYCQSDRLLSPSIMFTCK